MTRKVIQIVLFVFAGYDVQAERILTSAEVFETGYGVQSIAWLDKGAEIWMEEDRGKEPRVKVYIKAWVKRKEMSRSKTKPNATLYSRDGRVIGRINREWQTIHDTTGCSPHTVIIRGYILKDRIDPASNPEKELVKILDPRKSVVDTSEMNPYLSRFGFMHEKDTLGFVFYRLEGKDGPRMRLAFKDGRLVAVIPTKALTLKYFEAEIRRENLHVVYLEKLTGEEELFFGEYFRL